MPVGRAPLPHGAISPMNSALWDQLPNNDGSMPGLMANQNYNYPSEITNQNRSGRNRLSFTGIAAMFNKTDDAKLLMSLYDKHFRRIKYTGTGNRFNHQNCVVCLCDFETGDNLRKLGPCKHIFHEQCLNMWLGKDKSCPFCKENLTWQVLEKNNPTGYDWELEEKLEVQNIDPWDELEADSMPLSPKRKRIDITKGKGSGMVINPRIMDYSNAGTTGNSSRKINKQVDRRGTGQGMGITGPITESQWT